MAGSYAARRAIADREEMLDSLRRAVRYRRTAAVLESRARSASPALAGLLRERAAERRRAAERNGSELSSSHPTTSG